MTANDNFNQLKTALSEGKGLSLNEEVLTKLNNEKGVYHVIEKMPRRHVYEVYKVRQEISKENNNQKVEGFDALIKRIAESRSEEVSISNLTFETCKYMIFLGDSNELLGILKLNKTNLSKAEELNKIYGSKDIKSTSIPFDKGELAV